MDETSGTKLTGIRQIVRLKEILKKWQSVTINPRPTGDKRQSGSSSSSPSTGSKHGGNSPVVNKKLNVKKRRDSDEENSSCQSPGSPPDVPKGYLAVYVGPELRRFIIPTSHLSHSLFKRLLEKTEEEYGFDHSGALTIPCEVETFKYLLKCIENHKKDHANDSSGADAAAIEEKLTRGK